jgi:hypothetical protein
VEHVHVLSIIFKCIYDLCLYKYNNILAPGDDKKPVMLGSVFYSHRLAPLKKRGTLLVCFGCRWYAFLTHLIWFRIPKTMALRKFCIPKRLWTNNIHHFVSTLHSDRQISSAIFSDCAISVCDVIRKIYSL